MANHVINVVRRIGTTNNEAAYVQYGVFRPSPATMIGTGTPRMVAKMLEKEVEKKIFKENDLAKYAYSQMPRRYTMLKVKDLIHIMNNLADEIAHGRKMYKEHIHA